MDQHWKLPVRVSESLASDLFLHGYFDEYILEDSLSSKLFLVLHARDSVPIGSLYGSISNLVCVCVSGV